MRMLGFRAEAHSLGRAEWQAVLCTSVARREGLELHRAAPVLDGRAHLVEGPDARRHEPRGEPGKCPDQVIDDQDLAVAVGSGSDANGRDGYRAGNFEGNDGDRI